MPELIAKSPLAGQAPAHHGTVILSEAQPGPITSVAPYTGKEKAVVRALKPLGLGFPAPNSVLENGPARIAWTGRGQAFLIGLPAPEALAAAAALTDQSDGWACLRLVGTGWWDVLARLVPMDLRPAIFGPGAAARVPLGHMNALLLRAGEGVEVFVYRSMARSAWHEIETAMIRLAARG